MRAVILDAETLGDADLGIILNNGDQWQTFDRSGVSEIAGRVADVEIVLSNKAPISADIIRANPQLKLIMVMATGTNNVDLEAAKANDVVVCNVRAYGGPSVAQHTLALMLNLATNMPNYLSDVRDGEWSRRQQVMLVHRPSIELSGKRLGIIGYGELGKAVASLARAFGMEVLLGARPGAPTAQDRIAIDELLPQVDFLSLHCPLDGYNEHLINDRTLELMGSHSFLINTARGSLVDSEALVRALRENKIAGAAVDVLPVEPPEQNDVLIQAHQELPNLLITPHNAWAARESRQRLVDQVAEVIRKFQEGISMNVVTP